MNLILGMGSGDEILTGNGKMVGVGSRSMSGDLILGITHLLETGKWWVLEAAL